MKSVFIAGSRKFFGNATNLVELCKKNKIKVATAGKLAVSSDTLKSEKAALLRAFKRIEKSDVLYVVADVGHVGKTVAMEVAYAFSKKKEIISSERIEDFSVRALVSKVMSQKELIKFAK